MVRANLTLLTRWPSIPKDACLWVTAINWIQTFDQDGNYIEEWKRYGTPSEIFIDAKDIIYVPIRSRMPKTIRSL